MSCDTSHEHDSRPGNMAVSLGKTTLQYNMSIIHVRPFPSAVQSILLFVPRVLNVEEMECQGEFVNLAASECHRAAAPPAPGHARAQLCSLGFLRRRRSRKSQRKITRQQPNNIGEGMGWGLADWRARHGQWSKGMTYKTDMR